MKQDLGTTESQRNRPSRETIHNVAHNITAGKVGSITHIPFPYQSDAESAQVKLSTLVETGFRFVANFYRTTMATFAYLTTKDSNFACFARVIFTFVHSVAIPVLSTT